MQHLIRRVSAVLFALPLALCALGCTCGNNLDSTTFTSNGNTTVQSFNYIPDCAVSAVSMRASDARICANCC